MSTHKSVTYIGNVEFSTSPPPFHPPWVRNLKKLGAQYIAYAACSALAFIFAIFSIKEYTRMHLEQPNFHKFPQQLHKIPCTHGLTMTRSPPTALSPTAHSVHTCMYSHCSQERGCNRDLVTVHDHDDRIWAICDLILTYLREQMFILRLITNEGHWNGQLLPWYLFLPQACNVIHVQISMISMRTGHYIWPQTQQTTWHEYTRV